MVKPVSACCYCRSLSLLLKTMTEIRAFRGTRYNLNKTNLDDVTAPPYDVISPREQELYYEKSPHNIVRLDYGVINPGDTEDDNRYTRAKSALADWRATGVLQKDAERAIYVYRQTFERQGGETSVTGVICLVKLTEFGEDVLPHEKTLAGPKVDRRRLLEACEVNFSQIFSLFSDHAGAVERILQEAAASDAEMRTTDEAGVVHEVWALSEPDKIEIVRRAVADRRLLIADGHHRYETSLNYLKDMRAADKAREPHEYVMMFLVDMAHEDLVILPTHRLISDKAFRLDPFLEKLGALYELTEKRWEPRSISDLAAGENSVRFGLYAAGRYFELRASRDSASASVPGVASDAWKRLDTAILQETVLGPILGVSSGSASLSFTQEQSEAVKAVDSGRADLAFLLEPMPIDQVEAVAETGEKMPQKSTYFWPKPRTGLVMYELG